MKTKIISSKSASLPEGIRLAKKKKKNLSKFAKKKKKDLVKEKKKDLSKLTAEEFLQQDFENDKDDDIHDDEIETEHHKSEEMDSDSDDNQLDPEKHKKALMKLRHTDPHFYKFLEQTDKNLLAFTVSDDEDDDNSSSNNVSDDRHIPDRNLEVASDDSDFQPEEVEDSSKKIITMELLKTWQQEIQTDKSTNTIKLTIEAFHTVLAYVSDSRHTAKFEVKDVSVFHGVIRLCVSHLPTALLRFLKLDLKWQKPHDCKRFGKIRKILKSYLEDLIKYLHIVKAPGILKMMLRHMNQMLPYMLSYSSLIKPLLRLLFDIWPTTTDKTIRTEAFLNIVRLAISNTAILQRLLKLLYCHYVKNTRFVSLNTLPEIDYKRRCVVIIYHIDHDSSYNHAFQYIRQLAIHLRNAIVLKKKENFQAVYNWQYINSLNCWLDVINKSRDSSILRNLLYPLLQIIIGTIKVIPTAQYYPLRFHCVKMLITTCNESGLFIPVLPFLLEILKSYDFNKKHTKVSKEPISLMCILRASKSQMEDRSFTNSIIETIYELILEYAANESHKIYFPEIFYPCIMQLKKFLEECHVPAYKKKMEQLRILIKDNKEFIETERTKVTINLKNLKEVKNLENKIKTDGTAITKFYSSWIEIHKSQKLKLLTKNEEEIHVPSLRKAKKQKLDDQDVENSEEESEFEFRIKGTETDETTEKSPSKTREKKKRKKITNNSEDEDLPRENTDIVQDINTDDWN